jgi:hypothetical protein
VLSILNTCLIGTWLKQTFAEADKNGDGSLSISEVLQLLHKLNVNLPRQKVKQMFKVHYSRSFMLIIIIMELLIAPNDKDHLKMRGREVLSVTTGLLSGLFF